MSFLFQDSYLAVIFLALHISSHFIIVHLHLTLCVCVLLRCLSDLILKTPDRVSESQQAGALSHLSDEGFQVSWGQSSFLHILSMLFQPLVSTEAKEEPDTNLISLSSSLFWECLIGVLLL